MFKIGFVVGALLVIGIGIYGYFNMHTPDPRLIQVNQ